MIYVKRVYEKAEEKDGYRVLVDRLWPRGLNKEKAQINIWLKDVAPSDKLRRWFSHKEERWNEFKEEYFKELKEKKAFLEKMKKQKNITLLYAAKNTQRNNAVALKEYLEKNKKLFI